ncbi:hypothetical protein [Deinococcus roseus]|uniref:Uncharacterized protein n=1 Tax=Deinococcus roseus TaxID=392414 RepID=A0ABQ2DHC9_9DEIO|nr:hypothetical protein [Deinococcus roseus]GGJ54905.1 hypothetical protein GCM10008938_46210 [Deinococcus roseus]
MTGFNLSTATPIMDVLRRRAVYWNGEQVDPFVQQQLLIELELLEGCRDLWCVQSSLHRLEVLEDHLPSIDVTLLHALKEAVQNWLEPQNSRGMDSFDQQQE